MLPEKGVRVLSASTRIVEFGMESLVMKNLKNRKLSLREMLLPGAPYHVQKGAEIAALRKNVDATQEEFAQIIGVVTATVYRWEKGMVQPELKMARKLGRLKEIVDLLKAGFEVEGLKLFFVTSHPRLQGDRPMDLLDFDSGAERVKGLIESTMTGAIG